MLIKLTNFSWDEAPTPVLLGTESIIKVKSILLKHHDGRSHWVTKIESRGAMVETTYVLETVEEIHELTTNP
jgi:hypothetical protein